MVLWFAERDYFTVGSSKDDVLRVQGTPDEIASTVWRYGASHVFFEKDRVVRWDVFRLSPLKVKLRPSKAPQPASAFAVGSSKDGVFLAQGPPNLFRDSIWKYGESAVFFDHGRVVRWEKSPSNPLNVRER